MKLQPDAVSRAPERSQAVKTVVFQVDKEQFGLDIFKVTEITKMMEITRVPRSLPFIEGVVNLRGRVIPVLDLRKRLGLPEGGHGRIIIARLDVFRLGLMVDSVNRVADIPRASIEEVPPDTLQVGSEFIQGVGHLEDGLVIMLDLEKLLSARERKLLADRATAGGKKKR